MKVNYEVVEIDRAEFMADVSLLNKTDDMFFNATQIARSFGKEVYDFLKTEATKEYIKAILEEYNSGNEKDFKTDLNRFKNFKDGNSHFKNYDDLVIIKKGKYGGTWLHKELAFEFAGWCSALFRRKLHKWVEERLEKEKHWQLKRLESKTGYLKLSEAVMNAHEEPKFYHYSNEADMVNNIILGMPSKTFKELHNVDNVRDALSASELKDIEKLQDINSGLISLGMDYQERKQRLTEYNQKLLAS